MNRHQLLLLTIACSGFLMGCESVSAPEDRGDVYFQPLRPLKEIANPAALIEAESIESPILLEEDGPSLKVKGQFTNVDTSEAPTNLVGPARRLNINNMSLPAFINEIFGDQLGLSFTVAPEVQNLQELVTLRLNEPVAPDELFGIARRTLVAYGVSIDQQATLLSFSLNTSASANELPLIVKGRTLPDVPERHRPVFMVVPLRVMNDNKMLYWLTKAMRGREITIENIPDAGSLLIYGKPEFVDQALAMVEIFDQPIMRGRYTKIVSPAFVDVKVLARDVVDVLAAEGVSASTRPPEGGIIVMPLNIGNPLVVFSSDKEVLDHVLDWINVLDRKPGLGNELGKSVFYHPLSNAGADSVVDILNSLGESDTGVQEQGSNRMFIADTNQNAVIFSGKETEWLGYLDIIRDMDKPVASVLVELLLVEVTLSDQESTGIEFLARSGDVTFTDAGGLGLGANGLNIAFEKAGETRAVVNAFYQSGRANIRSNPRLMVKSGEEASIDVGNEIPVISSTSQSTNNPGAPVIQNIVYRKTGVIMKIKPTVHSSGYVDIQLSQELSEAQQNSTSAIDSPTIFRRKIETTVTLRDGGSVLLGGLISQTSSDGGSGVGGLGKIPLLGKLFRVDSEFKNRTELMVLVIPYILETPAESVEITEKAIDIMGLLKL